MGRRRTRGLLACLVVTLGALAACSNDDPPGADTGPAESPLAADTVAPADDGSDGADATGGGIGDALDAAGGVERAEPDQRADPTDPDAWFDAVGADTYATVVDATITREGDPTPYWRHSTERRHQRTPGAVRARWHIEGEAGQVTLLEMAGVLDATGIVELEAEPPFDEFSWFIVTNGGRTPAGIAALALLEWGGPLVDLSRRTGTWYRASGQADTVAGLAAERIELDDGNEIVEVWNSIVGSVGPNIDGIGITDATATVWRLPSGLVAAVELRYSAAVGGSDAEVAATATIADVGEGFDLDAG